MIGDSVPGWRRRAFVGVLPALLAGTVTRDARSQQVRELSPRFQADAPQVVIPFTAEDRQHHLVSGLTQTDFRLLADGQEQAINFLAVEEGPASVLVVLDLSRSMKGPVVHMQEAVRRILRAAPADDEFALIEFSDKAELTVDFTTTPQRVEEKIEHIAPAGRTSLTDAIMLALGYIRRARHARRAIVIVSDGNENSSRHARREALQMAVETDARIYAIELSPPIGDGFTGTTMLELLAAATGGRYLPTVSRKDIPRLVERIDIHRGYVLGFTPPVQHRDGRLHRVELKLRRSAGERVRLFWKERYLVPSAI